MTTNVAAAAPHHTTPHMQGQNLSPSNTSTNTISFIIEDRQINQLARCLIPIPSPCVWALFLDHWIEQTKQYWAKFQLSLTQQLYANT